jgi:hypothetical protein
VNSAQQLAALLLEDEGAWDFTSRIERRHVSVDGADGSWYLQNADVVVNWHLDMDVRSWGLKEANPIIKSISAKLFFEVDSELEGGQNTEEVIELNYPSGEVAPGQAGDVKAAAMRYHNHVSAEVELRPREEVYGLQCVPTEIEIDLHTNKILVFFQV